MFRFTYPETKNAYVVIDAFDKGSYVKSDSEENKIIGYSTKNSGGCWNFFRICHPVRQTVYLYFRREREQHSPDETEVQGNHTGAIISSLTQKGRSFTHVSLLLLSVMSRAELNLKELGQKDSFDQLVTKGKDIWNREMSKSRCWKTIISTICLSIPASIVRCCSHAVFINRRLKDGSYLQPLQRKTLPGYMFTDHRLLGYVHFVCSPFLNLMYHVHESERCKEGLVSMRTPEKRIPSGMGKSRTPWLYGKSANSACMVASAPISELAWM